MPNKNDLFDSFVNKLKGIISHINTLKVHFISFHSAVIISLVILIGYLFIISLINENSLKIYFSDIVAPIVEFLIVLCLFYVAKLSGVQGRQVQTFWLIIGIALLCYTTGDVIWAMMELIFHQQLFPSIGTIFYYIFYFIFVLGIIYLPGKPLSRNKKIKMILDTSVIAITGSIIFGIFLLPYLSSSYDLKIMGIAYAVGDFILFLALLRISHTGG
jgi:hypothetical protein